MLKLLVAAFATFLLAACQAQPPMQLAPEAVPQRKVQAFSPNLWVLTFGPAGVGFTGGGTMTPLGYLGEWYRVQYTTPANQGLVITNVSQPARFGGYLHATAYAAKIGGVSLGGLQSQYSYDTSRSTVTVNVNNLYSGHLNYVVGPGKSLVFSFHCPSSAWVGAVYAVSTTVTGFTSDLNAAPAQGGITGVK